MHRSEMKMEADLLSREWGPHPSNDAHPRINTMSYPCNVSEGSAIEGHKSEATTKSARINTDSAPRGVSRSEVGRMAFDGGKPDSDAD